ncbi:hypothetical protein P3T37_003867 [Kitasatospora sp. MAA4]|uniref:hypothetical protein n=1 Tax=Kitasatospora sp. MAA4 TaxID=3035093 RepID=UPI0024737759|nr:hypothetical protein [Kitasatospora sp. MAA4]MDH6134464.1 hypothetical protein [Kitasatospora sp. MAA4]
MDKYLETLRQLDDPEWLEFPAGYSRAESAKKFDRLVAKINSDFSAHCEVDRYIQDSAQHGRVEVPAESTVCGTRIVVLVSKFEPLAMVAADNPGAFFGTDDACAEGELDGGDLEKLKQALVGLGYAVAPEELLTTHYDGAAHLHFHGSGTPTWWDRFFGSF